MQNQNTNQVNQSDLIRNLMNKVKSDGKAIEVSAGQEVIDSLVTSQNLINIVIENEPKIIKSQQRNTNGDGGFTEQVVLWTGTLYRGLSYVSEARQTSGEHLSKVFVSMLCQPVEMEEFIDSDGSNSIRPKYAYFDAAGNEIAPEDYVEGDPMMPILAVNSEGAILERTEMVTFGVEYGTNWNTSRSNQPKGLDMLNFLPASNVPLSWNVYTDGKGEEKRASRINWTELASAENQLKKPLYAFNELPEHLRNQFAILQQLIPINTNAPSRQTQANNANEPRQRVVPIGDKLNEQTTLK